MKRTPLTRRTPLRQESSKAKRKKERRRQVVEQVRKRDRSCVGAALVVGIPCRGHLDVHELQSRGVRPDGELDPANCVLLCRAHHDWAHAHPEEAYANGLKRRSGGVR